MNTEQYSVYKGDAYNVAVREILIAKNLKFNGSESGSAGGPSTELLAAFIDLRELNVCVRIRSESRPALGCRIATCIASRALPSDPEANPPCNLFLVAHFKSHSSWTGDSRSQRKIVSLTRSMWMRNEVGFETPDRQGFGEFWKILSLFMLFLFFFEVFVDLLN